MKLPIVSRQTLEDYQSQLEELNQEYANYRRRNATISADAYQRGQNDAVLSLLAVYDNLTLALRQPCSDEAFLTGIQMTLNIMTKTLAELGITEIPALGALFDPTLHEAMEHIDDPEHPENTITQVIRTGFRREGTVLRHALVVVAN
jgi:molecular chaperone GrpE